MSKTQKLPELQCEHKTNFTRNNWRTIFYRRSGGEWPLPVPVLVDFVGIPPLWLFASGGGLPHQTTCVKRIKRTFIESFNIYDIGNVIKIRKTAEHPKNR